MGLDVLLGRKSIGHLPCSAVPHPVDRYKPIYTQTSNTHTVYIPSFILAVILGEFRLFSRASESFFFKS